MRGPFLLGRIYCSYIGLASRIKALTLLTSNRATYRYFSAFYLITSERTRLDIIKRAPRGVPNDEFWLGQKHRAELGRPAPHDSSYYYQDENGSH